ncbi:long-chain-fatty-acid--CoA ligase [Auritidibacter ignavus]|uniref:long-chain-fatty-acid--CoA ligase n=1 Tax=Auritidibacter ignavus TaxID=678932 RepID=UPI002FE6BAD9
MTEPVVTGYPATMMNDYQLSLTTLLRHACRSYGDTPVVYRTADGGWDRTTYAAEYTRIVKISYALRKLGVRVGDRVGVIDWNNLRHFEMYWALPALGAVHVQINLRLPAEDMLYVLDNAGMKVVCVDETLLPVAEAIAPQATGVQTWVIMTDKPADQVQTSLENAVFYEDILAEAPVEEHWPNMDENSACTACYTTGTTGRPKGIFYSHRSQVLHTYGVAQVLGITSDDCVMPITPMFHVSSWGFVYMAVLSGAKLVLPGRYAMEETPELVRVIVEENVSVTNGAPAIFSPMLEEIKKMDPAPDLSRLRMISGSSEPPLSMMHGFIELTGAEVIHGYGASETSPVVAVNRLKGTLKEKLSDDDKLQLMRKQGLLLSGIDFALFEGVGFEVPWDGTSAGEICMKGPWITGTYHKMAEEDLAARFVNGYWRSGDVGTIDENGYLKITDRIKDVIKSGGEWISSIDMENALTAHPKIAQAAVVGLEHPKWEERPFVLVVARDGEEITLDEIHEHLLQDFAKWQLPDSFQVVDHIPATSVGKIDKKKIRAEYSDTYLA